MEAAERTICEIFTEEIRNEFSSRRGIYFWESGHVEQLFDMAICYRLCLRSRILIGNPIAGEFGQLTRFAVS